jgi:hypothetical protein
MFKIIWHVSSAMRIRHRYSEPARGVKVVFKWEGGPSPLLLRLGAGATHPTFFTFFPEYLAS